MLLVAEPCLGEKEKVALADVIDTGWITMGDGVRAFERAFAEVHGTPDAIAVDSCTAGLHLALQALGIGPGDEVLVPSLTFVATANSVVYCGATPVFVDIESLDVPLISYDDAVAKCTTKTKAIIVMHYAGNLADGDIWTDFARSRGLALIEDSAHAVGAGRIGMFGDAAIFSFFGNKNMTTAEGGIIVARDERVATKIRQMRSHGMTAGTLERLSGRTFTYDVTMLGYNYRMDDLRAAIGLAQLARLESWNEQREALTHTYRTLMARHCPEVTIPFREARASAHHILPAILPEGTDRHRIMDEMRRAGIQTTIHYPPVHQLSWYREHFPCDSLPYTEQFGQQELTLPLHPRMDENQVEFVLHTLQRTLLGVPA